MTQPVADRKIQRVIVAVDDAAAAAAALQAAVQLASSLDARLTALFLENADLLRAIELPFLKETGAVSGTVRPIAGSSLLRLLRERAEQVRAAVAATAQASGLAWQFEVVRGQRPTLLRIPRPALDLLVLPQGAGSGLAAFFGSASSRQAAAEESPIALAVRDAPGAQRAFHVAGVLAAVRDAPLVLLLPGGDPEANRRLQRLAHEAFGGTSVRPRYVTVPDFGAQTLAAAVRQHCARLLVCGGGAVPQDARQLEALLSRLRCPLVMAD
jgi:nucleotide-binding universal stress UspA family protein